MKITPSQYARKRRITLQAVTKQLRKGLKPKGVKKVERFGRFYLLTEK